MTRVRPIVRMPNDWESFGEPILCSPHILEKLSWNEVGKADEYALRWSIKGQSHRGAGSGSNSGTDANPIEIEIVCPGARGDQVPKKDSLREILRSEIKEILDHCRKDKGLPAKCILTMSANRLRR